MPLDFQEVRRQIRELTEGAPERAEKLRNLLDIARQLLTRYALQGDYLRDKVERAAALNSYFRSAVPTNEALTETFPLPDLPPKATVIAADGSQINPDRHLGIEYCLVNVGAIQMVLGEISAPETTIETKLFYGDHVFTMQEKVVALIRDMREREVLAELAEKVPGPVITFTDGPIELWGKEVAMAAEEEKEEENYFERHMKALFHLYKMKAATAGYVDKPRSDLLVRLLEIAPDDKNLKKAAKERWLRGVIDKELLEPWLGPGERSAIFGLQSRSSKRYQNQFSLHFFYLNVSLDENKKMIARVEVPAWVVDTKEMVDALHAVLVQQCQVVPTRKYPYLLTRADETAVVTRDEKEQVDMMIAQELYKTGQEVPERSQKQQSKDVARKKPRRNKG
jgi:hypothetical protein